MTADSDEFFSTTTETSMHSVKELDSAGFFFAHPDLSKRGHRVSETAMRALVELGDDGTREQYLDARLYCARNTYDLSVDRPSYTSKLHRRVNVGIYNNVSSTDSDGNVFDKRYSIVLPDLVDFGEAMARHQYQMNELSGIELLLYNGRHDDVMSRSNISSVAGLPSNFAGANLDLAAIGPKSLLCESLPRNIGRLRIDIAGTGDMSCFIKHFETFKSYRSITFDLPRPHHFFSQFDRVPARTMTYDDPVHRQPLNYEGVLALLELSRYVDVNFNSFDSMTMFDAFYSVENCRANSELYQNVRRVGEWFAVAKAINANHSVDYQTDWRPTNDFIDLNRRKTIMAALKELRQFYDTY
jgi:hypothetical protein